MQWASLERAATDDDEDKPPDTTTVAFGTRKEASHKQKAGLAV
jgi:hypothetical protein